MAKKSDLRVLEDLFGFKIVCVMGIMAETDKGVLIKQVNGNFWATDMIEGVPMSFLGEGSWRYKIEI